MQSSIMMETGTDYVLQWPGHPTYVTERFSGLFAKQKMVDLTLICDDEKLKVHKLVMAASSLYFEEILEGDLGDEPVIFFKDLEFSILKAMIEFMYCGETTVSHVNLPSLLNAARLFKVKELESLVEKMVGPNAQDHNDNEKEYPSKDVKRLNCLVSNSDNDIRMSFVNTPRINDDTGNNSEFESEPTYFEDSNSERCLYDDLNIHLNGDIQHISTESSENSSSSSSSTSLECEKERCCDFVANGEISKSNSFDEDIKRVGQCSRVYTHKRRKLRNGVSSTSNNNIKRNSSDKSFSTPQPHLVSGRIDLEEEFSNDEGPVTLETNLDNESSDYTMTFSNESIQSIVGCSISDFCRSNNMFELLNARTTVTSKCSSESTTEDTTEDAEEDDVISPSATPVLRRSVRLHQQENEDNQPRRKRLKKGQLSSKLKLLRRNEKRKNNERRVPDLHAPIPSRKSAVSSRKHSSSRKETTTKPKTLIPNEPPNETMRTTLSSSVSRALWGDRSDIAEDGSDPNDDGIDGLEYSPSTEIPYAVGLLPLRAALEKLQATPDHQPRKTRSSVAASSLNKTYENHNGLKRKFSPIPKKAPLQLPQVQKLQEEQAPQVPPKNECSKENVQRKIRAMTPSTLAVTSRITNMRQRKRSLSEGAKILEDMTVDNQSS
uniref:BTB domain-containing protein n=1 Tax=Trichogramma kaykai TaxID=54128 RepID=A0ABD2W4F1_9HYME